MQEIVWILRELVDSSGLKLKGVQQLLLAKHRNGPRPPSYDGLSKRLRGEGLQNNAWLINSIIQALALPERKEDLAEVVRQHLLDARAVRVIPSTPSAQQPAQPAATRELLDALQENRGLRKEVKRLERRVERKERELHGLREQLAALELRIPIPRAAQAPEPQSVPDAVQEQPVPVAVDEPPVLHTTKPNTDKGRPRTAGPPSSAGPGSSDAPQSAVANALLDIRDFEAATAAALRRALDSVLDGGRTGRFDVATLGPTEKIYIGARIEQELLHEWGAQPGQEADLRLGGQDVSLKVTMGRTWTFSPEELGTLCLLVSADDQRSRWNLGLIRVQAEDMVRAPGNRDRKRTLSAAGRKSVTWLYQEARLPENTLLHLPAPLRERIFAPDAAGTSSQARTNRLFRLVQGRVLNRTTVRTVALQEDAPKRVRDARITLRQEGILVLGNTRQHVRIARGLGLPEPRKGEWVSQRVARRRPDHGDCPSVTSSGEAWTVARPEDPVEEAPNLDKYR
ncbi:NaeI family type II restriction endonuclease [Streptomyces lavendulae]|uniref:NaeI family type II restriction endonuclease n=1 Tax=Streptomyces lavendulae TaxID=1914 RepID=UPI00131CC962|nr:NaeI family type II restriction endonuclease [Streptomyces lavendulae]